MKNLTRENQQLTERLPIKVIQFGEGNFLRAFVEYAFQVLNREVSFNAGIAVIQPIAHGMAEVLNKQDGLYTLFLQGIKKDREIREKELITNVVSVIDPYKNYADYLSLARLESLEFVISNTTEAGISYAEKDTLQMSPPSSFPAKLTQFLYERFTSFKGSADHGLTVLPCELINYNSDNLLKYILRYIEKWQLGEDFKHWIREHCDFHNTLVDRIVPGYPRDKIQEYEQQLDYEDQLIVSAESFFLWVIEGDEDLKAKLPFHRTPLNVKIVDDMQPYRTRKVRILNGCHTAMVPLALMDGKSLVKETIEDHFTGEFVRQLTYREIIPVLDLDHEELTEFAHDVFDRFRNPFIEHQLSSIALNSISKFKVRVLPSLLDYIEQKNEVPPRLCYSFACLIRFYKGQWKGVPMPVADEPPVTGAFRKAWQTEDFDQVASIILGDTELWGQDLTAVHRLPEVIAMALGQLEAEGVREGFHTFEQQLTKVNKKYIDHV